MKKIALVTGGSSGIGREVATALSENQYTVLISGRSEEKLVATTRLFLSRGLQAPVCYKADMSSSEQVAALFSKIQAEHGRLDVLFNNAGISIPGQSFDELSDEGWHDVISTNLSGVFYCIREAFRLMKSQLPQGGRIINNGSISSMTPRPDSVAYTASKHGVSGLTKCASLDGRKYNIACGQIDIGNANTTMGSGTASAALQPDGQYREEPVISPRDVADAVVYMAGLPLQANVLNMTVMATAMPFSGRG